eukprot:CAMPEP_0114589142 /NCGR_PEP_ID=MMETSP0125-20121206/11670_1 /TAXON_ID=485358 ORGANISM="Aristerostoma sp., Strain ATCC 50986" /NCGR_SAMPLE_ID=MMETSP0125 /ASSEMBLY_ACC=CAM_ASM_000245 /LENGTH=156 /DNA_ID=CAMNT_0001785893 /DNA_START=90 /DNA_END=560 /DNA_ORIENTATION=+
MLAYGKYGVGGNNITIRGGDIPEGLPTTKRSKNLVEASQKTLRLFRKSCRLMPFILRIHDLQPKVTSVQAQLNLAECFREHSHLRDPSIIDDLVFRGYEKLIEAEQLFTFPTYLHQFICQDNKLHSDKGYSYLEEKKYKGKSKFLKNFYKGKGPAY